MWQKHFLSGLNMHVPAVVACVTMGKVCCAGCLERGFHQKMPVNGTSHRVLLL